MTKNELCSAREQTTETSPHKSLQLAMWHFDTSKIETAEQLMALFSAMTRLLIDRSSESSTKIRSLDRKTSTDGEEVVLFHIYDRCFAKAAKKCRGF